VKVKILEIDSERRRLSLSIKRVEGQELPRRDVGEAFVGDAGDMDDMPELGLSEDVFADAPEAAAPEAGAIEVEVTEAAAPDEPLDAVEEAPAADEAPRRRPPTSPPRRTRPRSGKRPEPASVRRADGRDRGRQVRGLGGARPPWRRDALGRRGGS
jgi:small subunit ribosomal protein S1